MHAYTKVNSNVGLSARNRLDVVVQPGEEMFGDFAGMIERSHVAGAVDDDMTAVGHAPGDLELQLDGADMVVGATDHERRYCYMGQQRPAVGARGLGTEWAEEAVRTDSRCHRRPSADEAVIVSGRHVDQDLLSDQRPEVTGLGALCQLSPCR